MPGHRSVALGSVLVVTACVDPEAAFDAFEHRAAASRPDAGSVAEAGACTVSPGGVEGAYVLALSVKLSPTKPILALTDVSTPALDSGTGLLLDSQPLLATDRTTPVGDPITLGPFPVADDGGFRVEAPDLTVSGAANPVTGGDIVASLILAGSLCGDGAFFCGSMDGQVDEPLPLDLEGSTFTLTRVEGTPTTRPVVDCAGTLADPL